MTNYIISTDGTVLPASQCYMIDTDFMSDEDMEILGLGSDEEVAELGRRLGQRVEL